MEDVKYRLTVIYVYYRMSVSFKMVHSFFAMWKMAGDVVYDYLTRQGNRRRNMKRKNMIIGGIAVGVLLIVGILWFLLGRGGTSFSDEFVYVSQVNTIIGQGSLGIQQRFSGVVEPQQTYEVKVQQDRTVKEILVEKGQEVAVGTPLFTYDTEQSQSDLAQAELDLDRLKNDIVNLNEQIATLEKEKRTAGEDEKLNYTTQIQSAQNDIKKTEYSIKSKNMEIEQLKNNIENATVVSEAAGLVKSINQNNNQMGYYDDGSSNAFITILETGAYRVKGMVNEQNIYAVTEGQPVIIRSRVDDSIWYGTMGTVDTENSQSGNNNYYYGGMDESESQSSKYPFYVMLDSDEGLMLGQHVYIEMDMGQEEEQTGLWLPEYFISDLESDPYVWADNGKGKLEKRPVVLGEYNPDLMEYEILEGLTVEDAITFPEDMLEEGMATQISMDGMMGVQLSEEDMGMDEEFYEEGGEL